MKSMSHKWWSPQELLPRADLLSFLLKLDKRVTGVAITGSLARMEPEIHDIDLVVLHDKSMEDGSCKDPMRDVLYCDDLLLSTVLENGPLFRAITQARGDIPADFIFVCERVLWKCDYLKSLEAKERFPQFYLRVFKDLPLILLDPFGARGALHERFSDRERVFVLGQDLPWTGLSYPGLYLKHQCNNFRCRPTQTWAECREIIKNRKNI